MNEVSFNVQGKVLETQIGEYQGNKYQTVKIRSQQIANNSILKYKTDFKTVPDFAPYLDKDVTVAVTIERGMGDTAQLRITALVEPSSKK